MWEIEISKIFYRGETLFTKLFECVGEAPALIPFIYLFVVLSFFLFKKIERKELNKHLLFSCYLIVVVVLSATVVSALKHLFNRVRFVDLAPNYKNYTPFWEIGNGGNSFPSGHASMSATSILLVDINERHKVFKSKVVPLVFSSIFTILTAFSRLTAGAHFITDLVFGILITLITRWILMKIYLRYTLNIKDKTNHSPLT